ncbi:MAG TPA: hypothetical protein VMT01_01015 [Candidatus Acidoferrum sp.]|jgi:hypothetical protein|nr:hypothetical protein [Candidatus Acidoferrum sp.]
MWEGYEVSGAVYKTKESVTLCKTDQGFVEVDKDTLAVPITRGERREGYVFHGHGKLVLDAIVETESGAVGEPIEKELSSPFLMLGDIEQPQQHMDEASADDLTKKGYQNESEFVDKAKSCLEKSLTRGRIHRGTCCGHFEGSMFMFPNETGRSDMLILHGSNLIYKSRSMVFISHKGKSILKSPEHVAMSHNGKCILIGR